MSKRVVVAVLVALAAVGAACGSDSDNGEETLVPDTPIPSGTRAPLVEPTIIGSTVIFPAKGYRLEIPAGWNYEANAVRSEEITPDFLIYPEEIDGVQANVVVTCEVLEGEALGVTLDQFFDNKAARAQRLGATDIIERAPVTVAGSEARLLEYRRVLNDVAIVRRDLLFIHDDCAWQLAYTAAPTTVERFQPDVDTIMRSFSFETNGEVLQNRRDRR